MGGIQMILSLGAMLIFALTSIGFNKAYLHTTTVETENKVYLTAFSLADDMLEEIKARSFDEKTIQFTTANLASLTTTGAFGIELGETSGNSKTFDDIDDFHNYQRLISAPHAEDYNVKCKIEYVDGNDPDKVSSTQTFYKRVTVTVSSPFLRNSVELKYVYTLK